MIMKFSRGHCYRAVEMDERGEESMCTCNNRQDGKWSLCEYMIHAIE